MSERIQSFTQFWPYYLGEHSRPGTRRLHFVGTTLAICLAVASLSTGRWLLLLAALVCGYAFAWVGHYFFEHNRPATFKNPFYSFGADLLMFVQLLTGKIKFKS